MNSLFNALTLAKTQEVRQRARELRTTAAFYELLASLPELLQWDPASQAACQQTIDAFVQAGYPKSYKTFTILKASGKKRVIHAPDDQLKLILKLTNIVLNAVFTAHPRAMGFKPGSSIVDNAAIHVDYNYVFNLDLSDFFTSIEQSQVAIALSAVPLDFQPEIADHLAMLACTNLVLPVVGSDKSLTRKVLPQGAPTSPVISNIVCLGLDNELDALANKFKVNYSRYADDITFSSNKDCYEPESKFLTAVEDIIHRYDFAINLTKTRLQRRHNRQVVTGLVVNQKVNVQQEYIRSLRMYLHYLERYGYSKAEVLLNKDVFSFNYGGEPVHFYKVIKGRLDFLRMVRGKDDPIYQKLNRRWNKQMRNDSEYEASERYFDAHKPKDVAMFLRLFQDSAGLKYLTHDHDIAGKEYNYEQVMELANRDFNAGYKQYAITRNLYARIKQYAFSKHPSWWRWINGQKATYNIGWNTAEMRQWVKENPKMHPFKYKPYRDGLINPFKDSIQVRAPKLQSLIESSLHEKFRDILPELNVQLEQLDFADFYTDVDTVMGGIRHLLDGIIERMEVSKEVRICFRREEQQAHSIKVLEIAHIGSPCYKEARTQELLNGNLKEAEKAFRGLCNWSITARFADGTYRLNILRDDPELPEKESVADTTIVGFTHTLYFY